MNVDIVPGVSILPGSTLEIPITFVPNESKKFYEEFELTLNEIYKSTVKISGEGVPLI